MARMVKCNATKEIGDSSGFIKIGNKYYKSKEVYEQYKSEQETNCKLIKKISELLGYDGYTLGGLGGLVGKKIKESTISKDELYNSLIEKEEYIKELFGEITDHYSDAQHILAIFKIIETIPESTTYGGCYEIKNIDSGEVYIGETLDFFTRINTHASDLYANKHHCKSLQDAFNKYRDFSHFKFTPLYLYEVKGKNREIEKHNTLYLECAYYLKYKHNKKKLYNTVNPYVVLKEKSVTLENYNIDCNKVLKLLLEDKENILPTKIKAKIENDLK